MIFAGSATVTCPTLAQQAFMTVNKIITSAHPITTSVFDAGLVRRSSTIPLTTAHYLYGDSSASATRSACVTTQPSFTSSMGQSTITSYHYSKMITKSMVDIHFATTSSQGQDLEKISESGEKKVPRKY